MIILHTIGVQGIKTGFNEIGICEYNVCFHSMINNSFLSFTESGVISLDKEVVFSNGFAVLKCYSIPIGKPLQYCRFLRPDGKGFNVVPANK